MPNQKKEDKSVPSTHRSSNVCTTSLLLPVRSSCSAQHQCYLWCCTEVLGQVLPLVLKLSQDSLSDLIQKFISLWTECERRGLVGGPWQTIMLVSNRMLLKHRTESAAVRGQCIEGSIVYPFSTPFFSLPTPGSKDIDISKISPPPSLSFPYSLSISPFFLSKFQ